MVSTQPTSYATFKQVVAGLGGNKKTPILAKDLTGDFQAVAVFGEEQIVILFGDIAKPQTFDADFPQAVYTDAAIGTGS